jgi:hypothetical protein
VCPSLFLFFCSFSVVFPSFSVCFFLDFLSVFCPFFRFRHLLWLCGLALKLTRAQVTVGFRNADTGASADAVRLSTESAAAPPSPSPASDLDADLYDPGLLLQAYSVTVSATVRFLSVHGTPCASRWVYTPPRTPDPFSPFRADRAVLDLALCCGSPQRQTKLLFNAKHVPGVLLLLGRSPWRMPCPDLSRVDVEGARLTVRHAAFTLLDAESAAEPGQGLRLSLAEMEAEFGLCHGTIHRASLSVAHVQGTLVANGAFYRKCGNFPSVELFSFFLQLSTGNSRFPLFSAEMPFPLPFSQWRHFPHFCSVCPFFSQTIISFFPPSKTLSFLRLSAEVAVLPSFSANAAFCHFLLHFPFFS